MKKLYLILIGLTILNAVNAQWSQLNSSALAAVKYNGIVYTGTSVIMATEGGIFRSTDNGITWNLSVSGIDTTSIGAWDMTRFAARNEVWISANGLYKTTDDGLTWVRSNLSGLDQYGWTNNISRVGDKLVIIYSHWDSGLNNQVTHLCYSTDGLNWSYGAQLSTGQTSYWEFIEDDNDKTLYFVESPNDGSSDKLWYSTNATSFLLHPVAGLGTDPSIRRGSLSIDPAGNNLFFRDEKNAKYFRYNFASETWEEKMSGIAEAGWTIGAVFNIHSLGSHVFGSVLFGNASSEMKMVLFYSSDNGENWNAVADPGLEFPMFESQMIIAGGNRIIGEYFSTSVCYSDDTGQSWTKVNSVFSGEFENLAALANGNLFTTTLNQLDGVLRSTDNGDTWLPRNGGLPNFMGIYLIDRVISAGGALYLTAAENPFSEELFLYKGINEGENWVKLSNAPAEPAIAFVGRNGPYPIFYFGDGNGTGTYQQTTDGGITWIDFSPAINVLSIERVKEIKGNGSRLILFGENSGMTRIYLSDNNGSSFSDITSNLAAPNIQILGSQQGDSEDFQTTISSFSGDGSSFYVAAWDNSVFPAKVFFYKLNASATSWEKAGTEGLEFPYNMNWHSLRQSAGVWYFVTPVAVYASINACSSWLRVWDNDGYQKGVTPASFITSPYGLFVGTEGTGIWRAPLHLPELTTLAASDITDISAVSGAEITSTGGLPFIRKGLCWSEQTLPEITDNKIEAGSTWLDFTTTIQPLAQTTTYYVRSFIETPKGLRYGNEIWFQTDQTTGLETKKDRQFSVFPNPSKGLFNISGMEGVWEMTLLDINGRVIMTRQINPGTERIELKGVTPGIYFIRLAGENDEIHTIQHVVK
jgi:photosystem II stability/assembly factor-like uncharacterized protein